jgi:hypothetical protein
MQETKQDTKNDNLKNQTSEAVDELSSGIRRATRKIFDACVQETIEFFSDLLDKYTDKTKEKIKGADNATSAKETDGSD